MNSKKLKKKKLALIAQRRAAIHKIDAILDAVEASPDKKETAEQTTQRKALEVEMRGCDTEIETLDDRIERAEAQETLERENSDENAERNDGDDEDENAARIEELEAREASGRLSIADARELRTLRAQATEGARAGTHVRSMGGELRTGLSSREFRDLQGYSFLRAFNHCLEGKKLDGVEGEFHAEGVKEYRDAGIERNGGNLVIPQIVLRSAGVNASMEQRDLTATGGSSGDQGGVTIATQLGSLIDRLRKKLLLQQMGVTMLGGLTGNIDFPKVIADDQAVEKAENATAAESSATFSKISMTPRRLPVFAEVSRQLLLQTSVDVEAWLRNDLAFQIAQVMDLRGINGSGSSQPYGILNAVGVGAVALGTNGLAPTYDMIVDLETAVANLDADVGALGYMTNTKVRGKLKKTLVGSNTAAEMIWDRKNPTSPLNDYKVGVSNQIPSNLTKGSSSGICSAMIFGNFNDALMAQWGGLEFLVNPYSKDTEGLIRLNCWTFYDFLIRRVESFAVCKDILTT